MRSEYRHRGARSHLHLLDSFPKIYRNQRTVALNRHSAIEEDLMVISVFYGNKNLFHWFHIESLIIHN